MIQSDIKSLMAGYNTLGVRKNKRLTKILLETTI